MTMAASKADMDAARALLDTLIRRGAHPWLDDEGFVSVNGKATRLESAWLRAHRIAFKAVLVEAGLYALGEKQSTGGAHGDSALHPTPADPGMIEYLAALDERQVERFNERAAVREYEGGLHRVVAERLALGDMRPDLRGMFDASARLAAAVGGTILSLNLAMPDQPELADPEANSVHQNPQ